MFECVKCMFPIHVSVWPATNLKNERNLASAKLELRSVESLVCRNDSIRRRRVVDVTQTFHASRQATYSHWQNSIKASNMTSADKLV